MGATASKKYRKSLPNSWRKAGISASSVSGPVATIVTSKPFSTSQVTSATRVKAENFCSCSVISCEKAYLSTARALPAGTRVFFRNAHHKAVQKLHFPFKHAACRGKILAFEGVGAHRLAQAYPSCAREIFSEASFPPASPPSRVSSADSTLHSRRSRPPYHLSFHLFHRRRSRTLCWSSAPSFCPHRLVHQV